MTAVALLDSAGSTVGRASVSAELAEQDIKPHLIHETVVAELAADRAGTHSTLTRSDVRGGGRKPWRQKGTGRARQGSIRAPQWTGGGVVFGPTPRSYGGKVNRKIRRQAFLGALRAHVERGSVAVMEPTGWDAPSTKRAAAYLAAAPERLADRPLLVVVEDAGGVEALSFRNLPGVTVIEAVELRTAEAMSFRALLVERAAWEALLGELGDAEKVSGSVRTAAEVLAEREEADRAVRQQKQAARAARLEERRAKQAAAAPAPAAAPAAATPAPEPEPADEPEPAEEPAADEPELTAEADLTAEEAGADDAASDEAVEEGQTPEADEEPAEPADVDEAADEDEEEKA